MDKQQPKNIALTGVKSSQLAAIGHDPESNTLAVQFHSGTEKPGSIYHYAGVTAEQFAAFRDAESIGSHFNKHLKHNEAHPYTRIG